MFSELMITFIYKQPDKYLQDIYTTMCFGDFCSLASLNQSLCHFQDLELLQLLQDTSRYASSWTVKKAAISAATSALKTN